MIQSVTAMAMAMESLGPDQIKITASQAIKNIIVYIDKLINDKLKMTV